MAKIDSIVKLFPPFYKTAEGSTLRAILTAISNEDDREVEQIFQTKNQLFVETAEGEFLDVIGANVGVTRTKDFFLADSVFRRLIPVLSYNEKNITRIFEEVLDVIFAGIPSEYAVYEIDPNVVVVKFPRHIFAIIRSLRGATWMNDGLREEDILQLMHMDSLVANTVVDDSTYSNSGTSTGLVSLDTGIFDNCLKFGPGAGYVTIPNSVDYDDLEKFQIDLRVKMTAYPTIEEGTFVSKYNSATDQRAFRLFIDTSGKIGFTLNADGGPTTNLITIKSNSAIPLDEWVAIKAYWDGEWVKIFINEDEDGQGYYTSMNGAGIFNGTEDIILGSTLTGATYGHYFTGLMDEVRIMNKHEYVSHKTRVPGVPYSLPVFLKPDDKYSGFVFDSDTSFNTVWYYENSTTSYIEKTAQVYSLSASIFNLQTVDDIIYLGKNNRPFQFVNMGTTVNGVGGTNNIVWEYWDGATWSVITINETKTDVKHFKDRGKIYWDEIEDWEKTTVNSVSAYWVRARVAVAYTTWPSIEYLRQLKTVITGTRGRLNQSIAKGSSHASIALVNSAAFPDTAGEIMMSYGKVNHENPIPYTSRPNNTSLTLDPNYVFEKDHSSGEWINLCSNITITDQEFPYAFWLTDTQAAADALIEIFNRVKAAGVRLTVELSGNGGLSADCED